MYLFIKAILDAIVKLTPSAIASRRKSRERELGARLFQLYLAAYDITRRGQVIVSTLKMARSVANSPRIETHEWWRKNLGSLLAAQSRAFVEFEDAIVDYGLCLAVLDPETFGALQFRYYNKARRLETLQALLGNRIFPVEVPSQQDAIHRSQPEQGLNTQHDGVPESVRDEVMRQDAVRRLWQEQKLRTQHNSVDETVMELFELVDVAPRWDGEVAVEAQLDMTVVTTIETYLKERDPEGDLVVIRELLGKLREALDENFTVSEILLELAGLRRLRA